MRQSRKIVGILGALVFSLVVGGGAAGKRVAIHPSFMALLKMHPRNAPIVNPQVPRISARAALGYYGSGKAIFIAAGEGAVKAGLPGAINLTQKLTRDPSRLTRLKGILIIIFCH